MTRGAEYWALLISTLLHDVPWKPWVVTGVAPRLLRDRLEAEARRVFEHLERAVKAQCRELKANDLEALGLVAWLAEELRSLGAGTAADILVSVAEHEWCRAVHEADVIAASIDRQVQPSRGSGHIVNIFNPSLRLSHPTTPKVSVEKLGEVLEAFLEGLKGVAAAVVESCSGFEGGARAECVLQRLYFALYALVEPIWYRSSREKLGVQLVPVADTRVPHHTVFEHCRAAATALAMRRKAIYAIVDIPGIHGFVAAARKTRDFWAGSWLLSLLSWSVVKPLVEEHGPQVVLLPSLQLNPFYIDMLVSEVPGLEEYVPKLAWRDKWPSQPLMPATVSLILDAGVTSCDELRSVVERGLREAWRKLWSGLRSRLVDARREVEGGLPEWCDPRSWNETRDPFEALLRLLCIHALSSVKDGEERLRKALATLIDYLLAALDEPPVGVRVTCTTVEYTGGDYARFINDVRAVLSAFKVRPSSGVGGEVDAARFVEEHVGRVAGRRIRVEEMLGRMLRYVYMRVRLAREEARVLNATPSYTLGVAEAVARLWGAARSTSRRLYRYCSVCGRLPAVTRLPRIGDELPGYGTVDEAAFQNLLRATFYLADEGEALCPYCLLKRLVGRAPSVAGGLVSSAVRARRRPLASTRLVANAWNDELRGMMEGESGESGVGERQLDVIMDIACRGGRRPAWCERLYNHVAAIYGDGDQMGKGYLLGVLLRLDVEWDDEAAKLLEAHPLVRGAVHRLVASNRVLWRDALPPLLYYALLFRDAGRDGEDAALAAAALTAAVTHVLRKNGRLGQRDWPLTLIPTPSYLRTLSTSLMVTSLVDSVVIEALRGVLVYAGGDDVAAIVPVAADDTEAVYQSLGEALGEIIGEDGERLAERLRSLTGLEGGEQLQLNVAWLAVLLTRLNYWGLLGVEKGFHVYEGIVAPAAAAHGRSYGVNIVHYRAPLWLMYSDAYDLMEEKDVVRVALLRPRGKQFEARGITKDVVVVGYEGGEAAHVPFYAGTLRDKIGEKSVALDGAWLISSLYTWIATRRYTRSLLYDVDTYKPLIDRLATMLPSPHARETIEKLLLKLYERNQSRTGSAEEELRRWVTTATTITRDGSPVALEVFRAVRNLASGTRR